MSWASRLVIVWMIYEGYVILAKWQYEGFEKRLLNQLNSIQVRVNWFDQLFQKIEYTSGIKKYIKSLNIYTYLYVLVLLFFFTGAITFHWTGLLVASLMMGLVAMMVPTIILQMMIQKRDELLSREMASFISTMARWSFINDDIYYCFEKSLEFIKEPISSFVQNFLLQVKFSGDMLYAYDMLLLQSQNEMFCNFIINLRQADYAKGDLNALLVRLEEEAYRIEGEHARRASETFFDRLIILMTILLVMMLAIVVLVFNEGMKAFYFGTLSGNYLLSLYAVLFVLGIYVASKISDFNY